MPVSERTRLATAKARVSRPSSAPESAPPAPDQKYLIRLFRPEDGIHVSRCAFRTYGYNYSREEIYYPERLIRLHETGAAISVVAYDEKGELAGCLAKAQKAYRHAVHQAHSARDGHAAAVRKAKRLEVKQDGACRKRF